MLEHIVPLKNIDLAGHRIQQWEDNPPERVKFTTGWDDGQPPRKGAPEDSVRVVWDGGREPECRHCGQRAGYLIRHTKGRYTLVTQQLAEDYWTVLHHEICPAPEGIDSQVDIEVPSGELVIADTLDPVVTMHWPPRLPLASATGGGSYIGALADSGVGHIPSGPTGMSLFGGPDGVLAFGRFHVEGNDEATAPDGRERLATIRGDAWSVQLMDGRRYDEYLGATKERPRTAPSRVTVGPGTYRLTQHLDGIAPEDKEHDEDGLLVLATMERA